MRVPSSGAASLVRSRTRRRAGYMLYLRPPAPGRRRRRAGTTRRRFDMVAAGAFFACAPTRPLATVPHVDLGRFMGDWYVQGHIPVGSESDAYNGVESYALAEDGRILTSYVLRAGAREGAMARAAGRDPQGSAPRRGRGPTRGQRLGPPDRPCPDS